MATELLQPFGHITFLVGSGVDSHFWQASKKCTKESNKQAQGRPAFNISSLKLRTAPKIGWQSPLRTTIKPTKFGPQTPHRLLLVATSATAQTCPNWSKMGSAMGQERSKMTQNGAKTPCSPCSAGPIHCPSHTACGWNVLGQRRPRVFRGPCHFGPFYQPPTPFRADQGHKT